MSPEVALNGHGVMSDLSPLSAQKRTLPPVLMLQTPWRSMIVIGTAPDAARKATADFLSGDRARV
jgi:hypothetical protein